MPNIEELASNDDCMSFAAEASREEATSDRNATPKSENEADIINPNMAPIPKQRHLYTALLFGPSGLRRIRVY